MLLRLSVDGETVARNLFEPLMRQLITWFTDPGRDKQGGITEMLEAVADGVCHQTNSTLREAAAGKFALLLKWSLKQHGGRSRRDDCGTPTPLTIEGLFQKMFHMATHPDPYKRIGASLAFRQLANEMTNGGACTRVVEEYLFEFIDRFLTGLRLSEKDPEALDAASLAAKSIRYCVQSSSTEVTSHKEPLAIRCVCALNVRLSALGTVPARTATRACICFSNRDRFVHGQDEDERYTAFSICNTILCEQEAWKSTAHYLDLQGWANDPLISLYENRHVEMIGQLYNKRPPAQYFPSTLAAISSCMRLRFLLDNEIVRAEAIGTSKFMVRLESGFKAAC